MAIILQAALIHSGSVKPALSLAPQSVYEKRDQEINAGTSQVDNRANHSGSGPKSGGTHGEVMGIPALENIPVDTRQIAAVLEDVGQKLQCEMDVARYARLLSMLKRYSSPLADKSILQIGKASNPSLWFLRVMEVPLAYAQISDVDLEFRRFLLLGTKSDVEMEIAPRLIARNRFDVTVSLCLAGEEKESPKIFPPHTYPPKEPFFSVLRRIAWTTKPGGMSFIALRPENALSAEDFAYVGFDLMEVDTTHGIYALRRKQEDLWPFQDRTARSIVENRLLSPLFVAYDLAWRAKLNPQAKDQAWIYDGSGPDVSGAWLKTNFRKIYFRDKLEVQARLLEKWRLEWPPVDSGSIYFQEKFKGGYSPVLQFGYEGLHGIEYFVIQELRAMGVRQNDISVCERPLGAMLEYTLPGESRSRIIQFVSWEIKFWHALSGEARKTEREHRAKIEERMKDEIGEGADGYMFKGLGVMTLMGMHQTLDFVPKCLKPKAKLLLGYYPTGPRPGTDYTDPSVLLEARLSSQGWHPSMSKSIRRVEEELHETQTDRGYGWKMAMWEPPSSVTARRPDVLMMPSIGQVDPAGVTSAL